ACYISSSISLLIPLPAAPEEVVMPPVPGVPFHNVDNDSPPASVESEDWVDAQDPTDEEEEEASSISSSTFYLVYSPSSFSSSSSLILGGPEEVPSDVIPSLPESTLSSPSQSPPQGPSQSPLSSCCSSFSCSSFSEESNSPKEEDTTVNICYDIKLQVESTLDTWVT
ncbi:hypothetical protein H8959_000860, partial [Pygathrix nigripes]